MDVRWSSMDLTDMMLVPKAVADGCLPTAGALPLKVLLWFARHGAPFDENACAAALKCDRTECVDALEFWMAAGVLTRADSAALGVAEQAEPVGGGEGLVSGHARLDKVHHFA